MGLQLGPHLVLDEESVTLEDGLGEKSGVLDGNHCLVHYVLHGVGQERNEHGHVEFFQAEEIIFNRYGDVPCGTKFRLVFYLLVWNRIAVSDAERVEYCVGIRICG